MVYKCVGDIYVLTVTLQVYDVHIVLL